MTPTIDVTIPVDPQAAKALESPVRREAIGRYLSALLTGDGLAKALEIAIADAKTEARANGLTDEAVDTELEAWRNERKA